MRGLDPSSLLRRLTTVFGTDLPVCGVDSMLVAAFNVSTPPWKLPQIITSSSNQVKPYLIFSEDFFSTRWTLALKSKYKSKIYIYIFISKLPPKDTSGTCLLALEPSCQRGWRATNAWGRFRRVLLKRDDSYHPIRIEKPPKSCLAPQNWNPKQGIYARRY
jgi:hypothetical protein